MHTTGQAADIIMRHDGAGPLLTTNYKLISALYAFHALPAWSHRQVSQDPLHSG